MTDDLNSTLAERGQTHGDFTENARVAQQIMRVLESGVSWPLLTDVQREALHMHAHKMARIVGGNPNEPDHWRDIAGYARLAEERVSSNPRKPGPTMGEVTRATKVTSAALIGDSWDFSTTTTTVDNVVATSAVAGLYVTRPGTPEDGGHHASHYDPVWMVPVLPGYEPVWVETAGEQMGYERAGTHRVVEWSSLVDTEFLTSDTQWLLGVGGGKIRLTHSSSAELDLAMKSPDWKCW